MTAAVLIVLGSVKGSPGVTSLAVALAARWPGPATPVVVEWDPAGGDLGSRWRLHDDPGLRTLVSTTISTGVSMARHGPVTDPSLWLQRLPIAVDVVIAPAGPAAAHTVAAAGDAGPAALRDLAAARPVLVDAGRLDPTAASRPLLTRADLLVLLSRPRLEDIRHLAAALPGLRRRCPSVRLVTVGEGPYPAAEIGRSLQIEVAATVRHDPRGAAVAAGRGRPPRGWARRPLFTSAHTLALTLARTAPAAMPSPAAAPPHPTRADLSPWREVST